MGDLDHIAEHDTPPSIPLNIQLANVREPRKSSSSVSSIRQRKGAVMMESLELM